MSETKEVSNFAIKRNASKSVLILSAFVFLYYLSVQVLIPDVYEYAIIGALLELLSIPMLLLLVALPILCLVQLIKLKGTGRGYAIASLALLAVTIFMLVQTS